MNKTTWMVRSGDRGFMTQSFLAAGVVAIGWPLVGDIRSFPSKDALFEGVANWYPEASKGNWQSSASQLIRFLKELKIGDSVVTFESDTRTYHFGEIVGEHRFDASAFPEFPNQRAVKWTKGISRDALSVSTKNSLGSTLTLFKIPEIAASELANASSKIAVLVSSSAQPDAAVELDEVRQLFSDLHEQSLGLIEDVVVALSWDEMQELVAGLLRGLGYKTRVSAKGKDRGVDITASPDGLGLREPRIFVEVKHRGNPMGSQDVRAFMGGRRPGDRCLYVSTGGFSQEARYEAERSPISVTLLNLRDIVVALLDNYEALDTNTKELLPLRRLYWPVS